MAFIPVLQKNIFDGISTNQYKKILMMIGMYIFLHIIVVIAQYFCMIATWMGAVNFEFNLKKDFFHVIFSMEKKDFFKHKVGEYISMQSNDITAIEQDYLQPTVDLIRSANMLVIYSVVMFLCIDHRIMLVVLLCSIVAILIPKITEKQLALSRENYQEELGKYTDKIVDFLNGILLINPRTIDNIESRHYRYLKDVKRNRYRFGRMKSISLSINDAALRFVNISVILMSVVLLRNGEVTLGTVIASLSYSTTFIEPIGSVLYDINSLSSVKKVVEKFMRFVGNTYADKEHVSNIDQGIVLDKLMIENGNFKSDIISFKFEKGKKYAIIGESGSGKSTLIKTLLNLIDCKEGKILINGLKNCNCNMDNIYYQSQDSHIFAANVIENATIFGSYPEELVQKSFTEIPNDIANRMRNNWDLSSSNMSGGEKQVILLLRTLASKCNVLILDEPFSEVDIKNREHLENVLFNNIAKDQILIMITHDESEELLERFDETDQKYLEIIAHIIERSLEKTSI